MSTYTGSLSDTKKFWFDAQGFSSTNSLNDQIIAFLKSKNSNKDGDLNTQWYIYLSGLGHSGTINDMYRAALIAGIGGSASSAQSITDLELSFYGNSANAFL